jgi:hypothetical protein
MINSRQSFRLRKQFSVSWSLPDQKVKGEGMIFNISLRGMLFVTDKLFKPDHGMIIWFRVLDVPYFPARGELVWFKKVEQSCYQCGVKFLKEARSPLWKTWMEDNILKLADAQDSKILDRYLDAGE